VVAFYSVEVYSFDLLICLDYSTCCIVCGVVSVPLDLISAFVYCILFGFSLSVYSVGTENEGLVYHDGVVFCFNCLLLRLQHVFFLGQSWHSRMSEGQILGYFQQLL
jgi:hypothetical protein